jgi:hypothetical protein
MNERRERIKLLLDQAEVLIERSRQASDPNLPRWRRVLGAYRSSLAIRRASDLMAEIDALNGNPRPAEKWLGFGRKGWLWFQFGLGVLNAWSGIDSVMKGQWFFAAMSFVCVIVTAHWRLPYAPPKWARQTTKGKS